MGRDQCEGAHKDVARPVAALCVCAIAGCNADRTDGRVGGHTYRGAYCFLTLMGAGFSPCMWSLFFTCFAPR